MPKARLSVAKQAVKGLNKLISDVKLVANVMHMDIMTLSKKDYEEVYGDVE